MKSRFVIKTEEKVIGLNGIVIPALNIETEVEYSLQEIIGAYELFKKAVKETPEILENISKAVNFANAKRDQEEEVRQDNCHHRNEEHKNQHFHTIIIFELNNEFCLVDSIGNKIVSIFNTDICTDIIYKLLDLLNKKTFYYLYLDGKSSVFSTITDFVESDKRVAPSVLNVISRRLVDVPSSVVSAAKEVISTVKELDEYKVNL